MEDSLIIKGEPQFNTDLIEKADIVELVDHINDTTGLFRVQRIDKSELVITFKERDKISNPGFIKDGKFGVILLNGFLNGNFSGELINKDGEIITNSKAKFNTEELERNKFVKLAFVRGTPIIGIVKDVQEHNLELFIPKINGYKEKPSIDEDVFSPEWFVKNEVQLKLI